MSQVTRTNLLLRSITPAHGQPIEVGTINVLVGGNNVGKSETLRDLVRLAGNAEPTGNERAAGEELKPRLLQDVTFVAKLSLDRFLQGVSLWDVGDGDERMAYGLGPDLRTPYQRLAAPEIKNVLYRPVLSAKSIWRTSLGEILPLRVAYLPQETRVQLIQATPAASPLRAPENLLQALQYCGRDVHERFAAAMAYIFDGRQVRLDETDRINLCFRVASSFPPLTGDPRQDARAYSAIRRLEEEGNGWRSCAAIVLALLICQGRVVLIDQPETDLQPETSRRLATWIAEQAPQLGTQLFVATRDSSFLAGLFGTTTDVSILRLIRRDDVTRFDLVTPDVGKALALFPLFTTQDALGCLLRDGVVVTAEEADRIVYRSVAERLLRVHNLAYVHAHNARNLPIIVRTLRRALLPTCVVTELDLFQSEAQFTELVKSLSQSPPPAPWLATRERLARHVEGSYDEQELSSSATEVENFLDQLKKGGATTSEVTTTFTDENQVKVKWDRLRRTKLTALPTELRVWIEELLDEMKRIGLFVSPKGRLQGWVEFSPPIEDKDLWFNRVVQAIDRGECPAELRAFVAEMTAYLQPRK